MIFFLISIDKHKLYMMLIFLQGLLFIVPSLTISHQVEKYYRVTKNWAPALIYAHLEESCRSKLECSKRLTAQDQFMSVAVDRRNGGCLCRFFSFALSDDMLSYSPGLYYIKRGIVFLFYISSGIYLKEYFNTILKL